MKFLIFLFIFTAQAQQTFNKLSVKELTSNNIIVTSTTKGSKPCPVMTEAQRDAIAAPALGDCVTNSNTDMLNIHDGVDWGAVGGGGISQWITATPYVIDDVVIESGKIYQCLADHTSGTFATDLTANNWIEIANTLRAEGQADTSFDIKTISAPNKTITSLGSSKALIETGNTNILANPSFEHSTYDTGWTCSGTGTESEETSVIFHGLKSLEIATSSQTIDCSQSSTLNAAQFSTQNGILTVRVKTNDVTGVISVCSLVNGSEDQCVLVVANNEWDEYVIPFVMGGTSSGIKVKGTSGTGTTYIDSAFVGVMPATMMPEVSQAQVAGESYYAGSGSCLWSRTSTTVGAFTTSTCPGPTIAYQNIGLWQTTDADLPRQTVNSLPAGVYKVKFIGGFYPSGNNGAAATITDGTTTCEPMPVNSIATNSAQATVECVFTYSSAGNRTFEVYGGNTAGTINLQGGTAGPPRNSPKWIIEYFPPSNKVYADQNDFFIDADIGGASSTMGSSASPVEITSASWDMVLNKGTAKIPCSTTNAPTGLTCSSGSESLGINFTAPSAGDYQICLSTTGNSTSSAFYKFVQTPSNAQTITAQGNSGVGYSSANNHPIYLCDTFTLSAGDTTIRLFYEANGSIQIEADRAAALYEREVNIKVRKVNSQIVGTFKDVVTSPNMGKPKVCHYAFGGASATLAAPTECTTGTCVEVYDSCASATPPAHNATSIYTDLTFAAGTFAASSLINCSCLTYDTTTSTSKECTPYFITSDHSWSTGSSGEYVMNMVTHSINGTQDTGYVLVRCEGVAP